MAMHLLVRKRQGRCRAPLAPWFDAIMWLSSASAWPLQAAEEELAVSYFVFPLVAARGQAEMQALMRSAVPLTGIPPPDALFSRLHFSVQAGSF
jgi:hypothetical protein